LQLKNEPAATQEPTGSTKLTAKPAETQEPAGPSKIKQEVPTVDNKAVQTAPMKEVTPLSQINLSTSRE